MKRDKNIDMLFDAILTLGNKEECYKFFNDACTQKEIQVIAQRFVVAKMLSDKQVYDKISSETGASTATISRVNRSIDEGYEMVFERLKKLYE